MEEKNIINRLKTKQKSAQDKRNWGMAKAVTKGEAWNMIIRNENLEISQIPAPRSTTTK